MKHVHSIISLTLLILSINSSAQNVGINTTGATPAATNLLEVLSPSTTASSIGIYSLHSGAVSGTGYGIWAQKTGASTTNIAGYFSASGATSNYAIIVPSTGGNVGIGTLTPSQKLEVAGIIRAGDYTSTSGSTLLEGTYGAGALAVFGTQWSSGAPFMGYGVRQANAANWLSSTSIATTRALMTFSLGGLQFYTAPSQTVAIDAALTSQPTEVFSILNNGNVGIGATNPSSKFHVNTAAANTTAIETIENSAGNYQTFITTADPNAAITGSIGDLATDVTNGILYFKTSGTATNTGWSAVANTSSGWSTTGNASTIDGTNFIGTTDGIPFNIKVNNQKSGRIDYVEANGDVFYGYQAGNSNTSTSGVRNTAIGHQALKNSTTADDNTALGYFSLRANTIGTGNTAVGGLALQSNTEGIQNIAAGYGALGNNTTGEGNTAIGTSALNTNVAKHGNVAVGLFAMARANNSAAASYSTNTAIGYQSMYGSATPANNTGTDNTALGASSLQNYTSGANNIAVGTYAGDNITSGGNNIIIGYNVDAPVGTSSNQMSIGNIIYGTAIDGNGTTISSGSIGIGTNAPASKLQVAGPIRTGIPLGGLGGAAATNGSIIFNNSSNTNTATIVTGVTSTTYSMTLPTAQGAANSVLTNDGAGALSWTAPATNAGTIYNAKISLTAAQIRALNTTPIDAIVAPGANKILKVINVAFSLTDGGADHGTGIWLRYSTGSDFLNIAALAAIPTGYQNVLPSAGTWSGNGRVKVNDKLILRADADNGVGLDTVVVYITYTIIDI